MAFIRACGIVEVNCADIFTVKALNNQATQRLLRQLLNIHEMLPTCIVPSPGAYVLSVMIAQSNIQCH